MNNMITIPNIHIEPILCNGIVERLRVSFDVIIEKSLSLIPRVSEYARISKVIR